REAFFATMMNWVLLWVCGRILHLRPRWGWLTMAAVFGGVYQLSLGIRWELGRVSGWEWVIFLMVGGFIAWLSWPNLNLTQSIRRIFLFYLLTFLTVGVSMGARSLLQLAGKAHLLPWHYFLINIGSLMIVAEVGWGMIREAVLTRSHLVRFLVQLGENEFHIHGLIDTGNMLRDPFSQTPVVILSWPAVRSIMPREVVQLIDGIITGNMPYESLEDSWQSRVRLLPFCSLGNSMGLLIGMSVEKIEFMTPANIIIKPAILGFTNQTFSANDYQAIVPAALFDRSISVQH
ncbi:MAG TPA: sigma-E processing peptidase SpoIIGA, partial [Bacillota bacterium]|nr:sigma-E processing peptidase SpoIIGA [Bacillota bacterium]